MLYTAPITLTVGADAPRPLYALFECRQVAPAIRRFALGYHQHASRSDNSSFDHQIVMPPELLNQQPVAVAPHSARTPHRDAVRHHVVQTTLRERYRAVAIAEHRQPQCPRVPHFVDGTDIRAGAAEWR
jgi:hypothetical protein